MANFTYLAKNNEGKVTNGSIDAENQDGAAEAIAKQGLTPISIKSNSKNNILTKLGEISTIPSAEKVMFSKQLATLVSAGIPISQSMHILAEQSENKRMKKSITEISKDIEAGLTLAGAMEKQVKVFSPLYSSMIKAGEVGGILDKTLEKMADEIEKEHELVSKIRGAMAYPGVILVAMIGVVVYMITSIIPQIGNVFLEMGGKLPASTQFLMDLSKIFSNYGIFILIGLIASYFGLRHFLKTNKKARYWWHFFLINVPVFGKIVKKINISRFSRTLGSLLSSGVTVLEALEISAETIQNEVYKKEIIDAAEKVKNGSSLADPLKKSKNFPVIVPQMIAVGEETGSMDTILLKLTEFYDKEIDSTIKNLSGLIEPIMMIFIGIGVGFIVISVISPIYQMGNLF